MARNYEVSKEAQIRASAKYDASNTVQFRMKLNKKNDEDILQKLDEVPNKQGYVKNLIRDDLNASERFFKNGKLADTEIILALSDAANEYENGGLSKVREVCFDIAKAIDKYQEEN